MKRRAALHTLGCKVNAYDTELMRRSLEERGYEIVPFDSPAEVYVVNTCSVTNIADRKSRQMLHRAKALNPEAVVVAAGCYVQAAADTLAADKAVDILVGNAEKKDIADILDRWFMESAIPEVGEDQIEDRAENRTLSCVSDIALLRTYDDPGAETMENRTRAVLKIQDGCNQFCSYCIIPYVRGRIRSRRIEEILPEAERLADKGFREFVLTGIHLSSYGRDLPEGERCRSLDQVILELDRIPGKRRIRLGSLEPQIVTEEFAANLAKAEGLCPHFHLSLQSGSDTVLKRMNRHYTAAEYLEGIKRLRTYFPGCAITTDVIAGFPGETEEEFRETIALAKEAGFYEMHVFPYSPRKGTRAAAMPGQVSGPVKSERTAELLKLSAELSHTFRERLIGQKLEILTEEIEEIGGQKYLTGFTDTYVRAAVSAGSAEENSFIAGTAEALIVPDTIKLCL